MGAGWLHVTDMRDFLGNAIEICKRKRDFGLGCNCHEVKNRIR